MARIILAESMSKGVSIQYRTFYNYLEIWRILLIAHHQFQPTQGTWCKLFLTSVARWDWPVRYAAAGMRCIQRPWITTRSRDLITRKYVTFLPGKSTETCQKLKIGYGTRIQSCFWTATQLSDIANRNQVYPDVLERGRFWRRRVERSRKEVKGCLGFL